MNSLLFLEQQLQQRWSEPENRVHSFDWSCQIKDPPGETEEKPASVPLHFELTHGLFFAVQSQSVHSDEILQGLQKGDQVCDEHSWECKSPPHVWHHAGFELYSPVLWI